MGPLSRSVGNSIILSLTFRLNIDSNLNIGMKSGSDIIDKFIKCLLTVSNK